MAHRERILQPPDGTGLRPPLLRPHTPLRTGLGPRPRLPPPGQTPAPRPPGRQETRPPASGPAAQGPETGGEGEGDGGGRRCHLHPGPTQRLCVALHLSDEPLWGGGRRLHGVGAAGVCRLRQLPPQGHRHDGEEHLPHPQRRARHAPHARGRTGPAEAEADGGLHPRALPDTPQHAELEA